MGLFVRTQASVTSQHCLWVSGGQTAWWLYRLPLFCPGQSHSEDQVKPKHEARTGVPLLTLGTKKGRKGETAIKTNLSRPLQSSFVILPDPFCPYWLGLCLRIEEAWVNQGPYSWHSPVRLNTCAPSSSCLRNLSLKYINMVT